MRLEFYDIRQAQKEENNLLNDFATMAEQMKLLVATRGSAMEALAAAHLEEVKKLKQPHAVELDAIKKQHKAEVTKMIGEQDYCGSAREMRTERRRKLRVSHNAAFASLPGNMVVKIKNVFAQDQKQKAELYCAFQGLEMHQQELLLEIQSRVSQEKTVRLTLLDCHADTLAEAHKLQLENAPKFIESCVTVHDLAQKYILEGEKQAEANDKIWEALKSQDNKTCAGTWRISSRTLLQGDLS
ncbi:hypothetical protein DPSP01_013512 [Paraphaeosphaeria sporulosa]|uniref:Uncharacterized protein n=1 Tax=Paraphaeosphaeria sporulosa TaxID=1460663 RepID=A0A177CKA0_9PLEO|nr:uncharacterized protein CC84DRAFT_1203464 [Paraphaeosphaeria sporulosa]OAG07945.1 hypothetical protein CC84DRAFT_1203464 [Paraphaeosphaeria sporulosa]